MMIAKVPDVLPKCSMGLEYLPTYHKLKPNVVNYSLHGAYEWVGFKVLFLSKKK